MKRVLIFILLSTGLIVSVYGQDGMVKEVAPAFFGPNAQPVPPMTGALVSEKMSVTLAGDYYAGYRGDSTYDTYYAFSFPFAARRMSLEIWGALSEWYRFPSDEKFGQAWGDVYLSTNIQICRDKRRWPDIMLRAGIKTASGGAYDDNRYFDSPGYFFDAFFGKSVYFDSGCIKEVRATVNMGFLCWQIAQATQNDAHLYGAEVKISGNHMDFDVRWGRYSGWRNQGDKPSCIDLRATYKAAKLNVFVDYSHGLTDYPFNRYRAGITVPIGKLNY